MMSEVLADRVALVTGAGRGLGWGIARAFGKAGARVCATDINMQELARAEADLKADASQYAVERLDAGDLADFQRVIARTVEHWGRLDVIVHCAILMPLIRFEDTAPELWWQQLQVSMGGMFNAARAAWEVMKRQGGGHLIGIASGSSFRGFKEETAYCAGKHGQEGFVKALSLESAPYKIAVNTMGPGKPIKTTRLTWEEFDRLPAEQKGRWADPVALGEGFVWLAAQPPERFSGYRFDAGTIADTIQREGFNFAFAPEKVTLYPADFVAREQWYANYPD
jgi:NAD(P)-dependent dehydrogenase (short-subunit alcohol dehydrogenase family)